jgi:hypothetical protein
MNYPAVSATLPIVFNLSPALSALPKTKSFARSFALSIAPSDLLVTLEASDYTSEAKSLVFLFALSAESEILSMVSEAYLFALLYRSSPWSFALEAILLASAALSET